MSPLISSLKIGDCIGAGHFGEVFRGVDPVHGVVAVKRICKDKGNHTHKPWPDRKHGLLAEARNLKAANHRNIVKVHHLLEGDDGDSILYVMDHCSGGSLQSSYEAGPMNVERLRSILTDVTQGLQELHRIGMIHRDIKPGNILIDDRGRALIGDFGLVTGDLAYGYASAAGYLDHLAPEVLSDDITSAKTDIWALGMTVYRLAHGADWYNESPPPSAIIPNGGFATKLRWLPSVPKRWRSLVRKALHDDSAFRFQSATELFAALSRLPIHPKWHCVIADDIVTWQRHVQGREHVVIWRGRKDRRQQWIATSRPLGKAGRERTMGRSEGVVGKADAVAGLTEYFESLVAG